ncbi:hypothetical protein GOODEAATRI_012097 [Goodea atripinnis]|uniref:Transmembrane protein n=1 Tax=Goodea atripinnis TaxID=208336 RepID=A0ABV0NKI3_9TELE
MFSCHTLNALLMLFLVSLAFVFFSKAFGGSYMKSSVTQIERRFDIPSSLIGVIDGSFEMGLCNFYDEYEEEIYCILEIVSKYWNCYFKTTILKFSFIGNLLVIAFVSYFGAKLHRPRLIGIGCIMNLPAVALGIITGGYVLKRFNLGVVGAARVSITASLGSFSLLVLQGFFHCDNAEVAGLTVAYQGSIQPDLKSLALGMQTLIVRTLVLYVKIVKRQKKLALREQAKDNGVEANTATNGHANISIAKDKEEDSKESSI